MSVSNERSTEIKELRGQFGPRELMVNQMEVIEPLVFE
jgi:hypothetical protein